MAAEAQGRKLDPWGAFVDRVAEPQPGQGPLSGLRLVVKDNIAVAGLKWTAGLPLLADRIALHDADCVAVLRAAGATVCGTVATDAAGFGMSTPGVVNPLTADRTVGGSSGGSSAAVAADLADIALGTDTAGSVRVPAACCGLYGLKPTFGRVSVERVTALSTSFDHVGLIAAHPEAIERALAALVPDLETSPSQPRRIGYVPDRLATTAPVVRDAVERTLGWLAAEGYALVEVELPDRVKLADMHGVIVCAEALAIWRDDWPRHSDLFADTARRSLAFAAQLSPDEIAAALARLPAARASIEAAFDEADLVIGPTIAVPTPQAGARRVLFDSAEVPIVFALLAETCQFNISGHPALAVPLPWHDHGIPISLQIAGRHGRDLDLIALARKLQEIGSSA